MSGYNSSDDEKEEDLQLASSSGNPKAGGSSNYLRSVVRQQQDATKTCRLLALEVGSLKAELAREQKKRAQAVHRAVTAEATQQQAEQRLQELQYSNNKLQQEVDAAHKASEANSRRVNSLRQSLADVEAEAQDMRVKGQQQVRPPAGCISPCSSPYLQQDMHTHTLIVVQEITTCCFILQSCSAVCKSLHPTHLQSNMQQRMLRFSTQPCTGHKYRVTRDSLQRAVRPLVSRSCDLPCLASTAGTVSSPSQITRNTLKAYLQKPSRALLLGVAAAAISSGFDVPRTARFVLPTQVQDLGLLASTLQALVTACCCNTHCNASSSSRGSHLATQLTRGLLEALIQLDRQLAGTPAVGAGSKPCAVDVTSLIQQAKQFVNQEQQQGWSCRQAPGSPGAAAAAASPTAERLQQQQQQQLESLRLQHLAARTAWEGERLQLQQDRAKLQLQVSLVTASGGRSGERFMCFQEPRMLFVSSLAFGPSDVHLVMQMS